MTSKQLPQWVEEREALKHYVEEPLVFVGEMGADGVVDGLLPNGEVYDWYKRRVPNIEESTVRNSDAQTT